MTNLNKLVKSIARRNANQYDKVYRRAMYEQNLCILAAFDEYCVDSGITIRQQERILNGVLADVSGFCAMLDLEKAIDKNRWNYEL